MRPLALVEPRHDLVGPLARITPMWMMQAEALGLHAAQLLHEEGDARRLALDFQIDCPLQFHVARMRAALAAYNAPGDSTHRCLSATFEMARSVTP